MKLDEKFGYFSHHLIHDYLAAKHVAGLPPDAWTRETLNAISFDRSSFDVVALVFGLLDTAHADLFLRHLYDWDLYAAGYALAEADKEGEGSGPEMKIVIFAMLAEKRFDVIRATQQRANDALLISRTPEATPFRDATSFEEVIAATAIVTSQTAWFNDWRRLFSTPIGVPMADEDLNQITEPDSVKGWTVANVAKRTSLSEAQQVRLRGWVRGDDSVVRWRAVHALGSFPSEANFTSLLDSLDGDPEVDVRYGAIRSLVEMACRADVDLRDRIFEEISARAPRITSQPRVEAELARALIVAPSDAPAGWSKKAKHVARDFFQVAQEMEKRDTWRSVVGMIDFSYAQ